MLGAEWGTLFVSSLFLAFLPGQGTNLEDEPGLGRRQPATLQPSAPMVVCCPLVGAEGTVTTWLPLGRTLPSGRKIRFGLENSQVRRRRPHCCVLAIHNTFLIPSVLLGTLALLCTSQGLGEAPQGGWV